MPRAPRTTHSAKQTVPPWKARSSPSRRYGATSRFPMCCCPVTTGESPPGARSRPTSEPTSADPTSPKGERAGVWHTCACFGTIRPTSATRDARGRITPRDRGRLVALTGRDKPMKTLDPVDAAVLRDDIPDFRAGDTVKVHVKVVEGNKTRVQIFQGVVIARSGTGASETYTVRKVSYGVG